MSESLPVGKLPYQLMASLLARAPCEDPRVLVGPGPGMDCGVVDTGGDRLLVFKSDPITFVADDVGEYLVRINTNDIATTAAEPSWLLLTLLLPEGGTPPERAQAINDPIFEACRKAGIAVIGGHTEVTHGLDRPIAVGALVGEVSRDRLVTPRGAMPGDRILLTKGVPIEGTAILAGELGDRLTGVLSGEELARARDFPTDPGIDVLEDARVATGAGRVTAMHDPTEGGLATALWELAEASGRSLEVDTERVPVPDLARRVCRYFGLAPLATIASGALLLTSPASEAEGIGQALAEAGIPCSDLGEVKADPTAVSRAGEAGGGPLDRPDRDEIGKVYEG
ncbi:AIR synthase family protein [Thiohalorhabdus sp.]|uniref:AIR synthase family protein n=1 Tax=Thiohalorhabdus sp. TaxID=3094134 RepID=UPI002FC36224